MIKVRTPMHKLRDDIAEVILNVHDFAPDMTRSDLQGVADAEAANIIELCLKYFFSNQTIGVKPDVSTKQD